MPVSSWLSKVSGNPQHTMMVNKAHGIQAGESIAQVGEGALVGALLGAANVELTNGLDFHSVPLDLAVGAAGIVGALLMANESVARDLRNAGAAGLTVYAFRKTQELLASAKAKKGLPVKTKIAGEFGADNDIGADDMGVDPIIAAAQALR